MTILYTTGCPKCKVLKKKMASKSIQYQEVSDVEEMTKLGITHVPMLMVDGNLLSFAEANKWINDQ